MIMAHQGYFSAVCFMLLWKKIKIQPCRDTSLSRSTCTFLGLSLRKSSAASEVVTLQPSPTLLPKVKWLLDLLEKVLHAQLFGLQWAKESARGDETVKADQLTIISPISKAVSRLHVYEPGRNNLGAPHPCIALIGKGQFQAQNHSAARTQTD